MNQPIDDLLAFEQLARAVWSYRFEAIAAMASVVGVFIAITTTMGVLHRRRMIT